MEKTRALAAEFVAVAYECLDAFPDSLYKRALEALPRFVLTRYY